MKYTIDENKLHDLFTRWKGGRFNITLNQAEKANRVGVSQSVISRLDSRAKKFGELKAHHLINLCNELEIHPAEILTQKTN